jgi:cytochrome b561
MLVEMAYNFTRNMVHELIGISLFTLFIIYNILNRRWYQTIFRGKMNVRRILNITVNLLLLVAMVIVMISAIPISRIIFTFLQIHNSGLIARQIHTLAAYWGLILMAIHIGMHWGMIIGGVRKMIGISGRSRVRTIVLQFFAVLIVVNGVQASFSRVYWKIPHKL